jgi:hypothetical protein
MPAHHKPDLIRAIRYTIDPTCQLLGDPTFRGRRQLQIIECKYSTYGNTQANIGHVYTVYKALKQALKTHGTLWADIKIIPIFIQRTRTLNVKTVARITQLVSVKEGTPNVLTYKQLPKSAKAIAMALHVHTHAWLSHLSRISRKRLATKTKR